MENEQITSRLGKYEIAKEIGRGGFAVVYRARDPDLGREVALKVLHPALMTDPTFVERFRREARAAGRLQHPGIVTIHEIGEAEGRLYIAMELLPGPSLAGIIAAEAPMTVERAVDLLRPLAEALDYAHAQGVVHRDLKPSNVILNTQGRPVLTDFGLVRAAEGDVSSAISLTLSRTGMTLGTPAYMAPEQCDPEASGPVDYRADLYSLGVVAYEMLAGQAPFQGNTPLAVAMGHLMKEPPPPREMNPELTEQVEATLGQALAKSPEARFSQALVFVGALEARKEVSQSETPRLFSSGLSNSLPPTKPVSAPTEEKIEAPISASASAMSDQADAAERAPGWNAWFILAYTLSWVIGWGAVSVTGPSTSVSMTEYGVAGWVLHSAVGWIVGGAIGGAIAGLGQWFIVRRRIKGAAWWAPSNALGWAIGPLVTWTLTGLLGSDILIWVGGWIAGWMVGGIGQWLIMRHRIRKAAWWVLASTVGGAISWTGTGMLSLSLTVAIALVTGAITGLILTWLLNREPYRRG